MFKITREIISPQSVISAVEVDNAGAIVHFMGTVRNNTGGRKTLYLEYEAYAPMAEKKMTEIGQEIQEKWGLERVAMIHRVGRLEIGEVSVAVAVASPHRSDGFEACKYAMDRLKQVVPIWKREIWENGAEEWVKPDSIFFDANRGVHRSDS